LSEYIFLVKNILPKCKLRGYKSTSGRHAGAKLEFCAPTITKKYAETSNCLYRNSVGELLQLVAPPICLTQNAVVRSDKSTVGLHQICVLFFIPNIQSEVRISDNLASP